jgi:cytochrome c oxidase subunit 4
MRNDQEHNQHHPSIAVYLSIFGALLVLLAITVAVAEMEFGRWNFPVAALIATVKAVLIILFFMHVRYSTTLTWLFAFASFFWLAILFALTLADVVTR